MGPGVQAQGLRQRPVSPGFTEIMPWQSVPLEESLPTCQRGDTFPVGEVKLLEKQTSPPDYLTEAELITLMEKHGIGGCTRWDPGRRVPIPRPAQEAMLPELPMREWHVVQCLAQCWLEPGARDRWG